MRKTANGPTKASKSRKNQPQSFQESMAPTMQQGRTLGTSSRQWVRPLLFVIWALAAVAAGIGIGLLLRANLASPSTVAPSPVATAVITPATVVSSDIGQSAAPAQQSLTTTISTSVQQAQAGTPSTVAATPVYQTAAAPDALQPGYQTPVHTQGNVGTSPVR